MTIGERPNKKNIESLNLTRKVNLLRLWRGKYFLMCPKHWRGDTKYLLWSAEFIPRKIFPKLRFYRLTVKWLNAMKSHIHIYIYIYIYIHNLYIFRTLHLNFILYYIKRHEYKSYMIYYAQDSFENSLACIINHRTKWHNRFINITFLLKKLKSKIEENFQALC